MPANSVPPGQWVIIGLIVIAQLVGFFLTNGRAS